ncbi:MAG: alpha-hydroxy-acid oxidizing protein, partial [Rhodospirillaceae bacterium]|nr:alpha-hydroxy-acid oxidizing protein [Rhodospirillaceae bacterium]
AMVFYGSSTRKKRMTVDQSLNIAELHRLAKKRLPRVVFDYIAGGAEDEIGLGENAAAFSAYKLLPRFLTACGAINLETTLFGKRHALPFGIGPTGIAGLFHPDGDRLLAVAALQSNIPYIMSGTSSAAIEDLSPESAKNAWYQLYTGRDTKTDEDIVRRARDAGMETLVLTVDSEVRTKRERDLHNGFFAPRLKLSLLLEALTHPAWVAGYIRNGGRPPFGNFARYAGGNTNHATQTFMMGHLPGLPTWADVARYRKLWPGALVIKGLLDPEDAKRAVEHGVNGIIVSNHGGRNLDRAPSSLAMLPVIREAVGKDMTLIFDSGIRRGSDIITALCLGAQFVLLGRATLYGLAAGGLPGARKAIEILRQEVETNGRQMGCADIAAFDRSRIVTQGRRCP